MVKVKIGTPETSPTVTDSARVRNEAIRAVRMIIAQPNPLVEPEDHARPRIRPALYSFRSSL